MQRARRVKSSGEIDLPFLPFGARPAAITTLLLDLPRIAP